MSFRHINAEDRTIIEILISEQRTKSYIARRLGVNCSTIVREIERNQIKPKVKAMKPPPKPSKSL